MVKSPFYPNISQYVIPIYRDLSFISNVFGHWSPLTFPNVAQRGRVGRWACWGHVFAGYDYSCVISNTEHLAKSWVTPCHFRNGVSAIGIYWDIWCIYIYIIYIYIYLSWCWLIGSYYRIIMYYSIFSGSLLFSYTLFADTGSFGWPISCEIWPGNLSCQRILACQKLQVCMV